MAKRSRRDRKRTQGTVVVAHRPPEPRSFDPFGLNRPAHSPGGSVYQGELFPATLVQAAAFAGPLPHPETLKGYDVVLPGLAERIVRMAAVEGDHRRGVERSLVRISGWGLASASAICLIALVGGFALLWAGKTLSGLAPILLALAGLITTLVLQRNAEPSADTADGEARGGRA